MKNKNKLEDFKINFIRVSKLVFKYFLYLSILCGLIFGVYKIFNWKKIFDREYDSAQIIKRKIDLPPIIKNASSTRDMSYADQVFLENIIDKLKIQDVNIKQIEEVAGDIDVHMLTSNGYRILISYNLDNRTVLDNIVSVYTDKNFKSEIEKNKVEGKSDLEYIDFRFRDKVFYKFKDISELKPIINASSTE